MNTLTDEQKQAFENLYATLAENTDYILNVDCYTADYPAHRMARLDCILNITTSPVWRNGWLYVADYDAIMCLGDQLTLYPEGLHPQSMLCSRIKPVVDNDWLASFADYLTDEQGVYLAGDEDIPSLEYIHAMESYTLKELDAQWPVDGESWPYYSLYQVLFNASIPYESEKEA